MNIDVQFLSTNLSARDYIGYYIGVLYSSKTAPYKKVKVRTINQLLEVSLWRHYDVKHTMIF